MLNDIYNSPIEGHVKLEKKKDGEIVDVFENDNTVVYNSNKIISRQLSSPIEKKMNSFTEEGSTPDKANANGYFEFSIPFNSSDIIETSTAVSNIDINESEEMQEYEFQVESTPVFEIIAAEVRDIDGNTLTELTVEDNIFIDNDKTGMIGVNYDFSSNTDTDQVYLKFYQRTNYSTRIIPGSEVVYAGTDEISAPQFQRSTYKNDDTYLPDTDSTTDDYGINYKTGMIYFGSEHGYVSVEFEYEMAPGVNYMGLSDKPEDHDAGSPMNITKPSYYFTNSLDDEYLKARRPINFPCEYTVGSDRDPVSKTCSFEGFQWYEYDVGEPIYEVIEAYEVTNDVDLTLTKGEDYTVDQSGVVSFKNEAFTISERELTIHYGSDDFGGTSLYASYSYTDPDTGDSTSTSKEYIEDVVNLTTGDDNFMLDYEPHEGTFQLKVGDDSSASVYTLSKNFKINYVADDGVTVNFVTDFPSGSIEARDIAVTENFEEHSNFSTPRTFDLEHEAVNLIGLQGKVNEDDSYSTVSSGNYTLDSGDIIISTWPMDGSDNPYEYFKLEYEYYKEEFGVYEVGMFSGIEADATMFSIAGLGPVYVDPNTGLRITWSITFKKPTSV